ncbi:MAG: hypothetical protein AAB438_04010 [Patescibacteria group bacterium]
MTKFGKIALASVFLVGLIVVVWYFQKKDNTNIQPISNEDIQILGNKDDLVMFSILPSQRVHGVLSYRGDIKGGYFFEGNILINILDKNKNLLKASNGIAKTDWMTSGLVSFEGNIDFTNLPVGPAYFEIHNDNASGLPEHDKSILIPIIIEETPQTQPIKPSEDLVLAFLKSLVVANPNADIKECKKDGVRLFALYLNTGIADAPTTFYDDKGIEIETCGGHKATPDVETSLCKTTLSICESVYYQSYLPEDKANNVDVYKLK